MPNTWHSGIQGCVVCPVWPSGVAVPCCPIGEYTQPTIRGYNGDWHAPKARPLTDKKRPLRKNLAHEQGESFPS